MNHDEFTVTNNRDLAQYEIRVGGAMIGLAAYQKAKAVVVFTHTEVDPASAGTGAGTRLVRAALDDVRAAGLLVLPLCPFVQAFMTRHPEYADLDYRNHRTPSTARD